MNQVNRGLFVLCCAVVFALIAYKVLVIPITHDEPATVLHYFNYSPWEIMMYPDNWPNNHILNTLITKAFINIGGKEQWVVRLPNLLFFLVYCFGVYRISKLLNKESTVTTFVVLSLFLCNPYLLDFFGLCRGYGMAAALVTLSASYLLSAYIKHRRKSLWLAILFATLAAYANFTTLIFWVAVYALALLYLVLLEENQKRAKVISVSTLFLSAFAFLGLIYTPIKKMSSTNQFVYWTSGGFYRDTITSLSEKWLYGRKHFNFIDQDVLAALSTFVLIAIGIFVVRKIWRLRLKDALRDPSVLSFLLLVLTATISIVQCAVLGTPNLSGRTAVFFYPLFALCLSSAIAPGIVKYGSRKLNLVALLVPILLGLHLARSYNTDHVREWWYDESTFEVLDYLEEQQADDDNPLLLNLSWWYHPSFNFYSATGKTPGIKLFPYSKEVDPASEAAFYYVSDDDAPKLDANYEKVKKFGWNRWLMKRKVK